MRVVVTGSAGYIGRPLVDALVARGHAVVGIDVVDAPYTRRVDVRELPDALLEGADAVVHLAAISFAPEWDDVADLIADVNVAATRRLVGQCEAAGVPRFVLASSASIFESHVERPATVATVPAPVSDYGRSKVECERTLAASTIRCRVALRKGTVCGLGPNPRLDLLTNAMSVAALRHGAVFVDGDGTSQRPILRLDRAVFAYAMAATSALRPGFHTANVCDDNVVVRDIAREVCRLTGADLVHRAPRGRARSYRVLDGRSRGYDAPDRAASDAASIVRAVVAEARAALAELPIVSSDPRVDRIEQLRGRAAVRA